MIFVMIFLYLLIFLVFLAVLILILDFTVILSYEEYSFKIKIRVLGIVIKIPMAKKEEKEHPKKKEETENSVMKKFLDLRNEFTRKKESLSLAISYLRDKVVVYETGITGEFGLGNAAATGIAYGSIHAFVGTIIGFLAIHHRIEGPPSVNIDLNYDKIVFKLNFSAVLKLKLYHLLKAIIIFNKNK